MNRDPYFDFLRGVAIVFVVAIHCYSGEYRFSDGWLATVAITFRNIMNCAVPIFLTISGYFIGKRAICQTFDWKTFWKKQVLKIYIPCLVFSVPWLLLNIYNGAAILPEIIVALLCGMSVYYFILLIITCYFAAPLMMRLKDIELLSITAIVSFSAISACMIYNAVAEHGLPLIVQGSIFSYCFFFAAGLVLGRTTRMWSIKWPVYITIIGAVISLIESLLWQIIGGGYGVGQKFSSFIFSSGVILLSFCPLVRRQYRDTLINRIVRWIGNISFGIYFTHVLVILFLKWKFMHMMESWIVSTIVTMFVTICIILICKTIAPTVSKKYLGYR